ncbi:small conductance mechanosensitive channel [Salinibacter ruber]|uniref:mechanosensitive ion channel family protein n=1 Tax=Salinibacter ruber TaxID=146919 RepID=UPI0021684672|nr:mechanosensitive ion channel family protein [Salinibacter ruber]MCS3863135.1 small conductance mechanosensitive channel [Salinibacter ruber]
MVAPQSIPQRLQTRTDTTAQSGPVGEAANRFNNAFSDGLRLFLDGNWEGLYDHLTSGALYLLGLLTERGLQSLAAFLLLYIIYRALYLASERALDRSDSIEPGLQSLLLKTFRVASFFFIGTVVLDQLGVNVAVLVGGLGIAGIVAGFAARDSLENFIAGVTVLVDKPFQVGDYIEIGDQYGQVDEITLRSTRLRTVRNRTMVLPNTHMITQELMNHTKRNVLRIDVSFGIAYKEVPDEARAALLSLFEGDDRVLTEPAPSVVVTEMADSSVNMALRFYTRNPDQEVPLRWEYTEKVREKLREADIEIPFPHRQLFLDEAKALQGSDLLAPADDPTNGEGPSAE